MLGEVHYRKMSAKGYTELQVSILAIKLVVKEILYSLSTVLPKGRTKTDCSIQQIRRSEMCCRQNMKRWVQLGII